MQPLVEGEGVITELGTFTLLLDVSSKRRQKQWKFAQPIHPSVCAPLSLLSSLSCNVRPLPLLLMDTYRSFPSQSRGENSSPSPSSSRYVHPRLPT